MKSTKPNTSRYRHVCMLLDVLMLTSLVVLMACIFSQKPSVHYDPDRTRYPIKGIDVSAHNGDIDFVKALADTVSFVMVKATEGGDFCDGNFNINYQKAHESGLKVGAYHFFRFDTPGALQAQHFLGTVEGRRFEMPLAIDIEKWGNPETYEVERVKANLRIMIDSITRQGYPVMIYTNKQGYNAFVCEGFEDVPLWICTLSKPPIIKHWALWQHSHKYHINGAKGDVDANTFNGDIDEFELWTRPYTVGVTGIDTI